MHHCRPRPELEPTGRGAEAAAGEVHTAAAIEGGDEARVRVRASSISATPLAQILLASVGRGGPAGLLRSAGGFQLQLVGLDVAHPLRGLQLVS